MPLILSLLCGIILLLGGLGTMRYGLSRIFSRPFRRLLATLTVTPWRGMLAGTVGAALMQSSTALTLATVGLVSAGYLSFEQGLGLILGANIGTCSTVGLLTFTLPLRLLLPLLAVCAAGAALAKGNRRQALLALTGMLAMLTGVGLLSQALGGLAEADTAVRCLTVAGQNPLYGIGGGIVLTFLFQSSSAATGLLMALAQEGMLDTVGAAYGVYGNNIGSCLSSAIVGAGAPLPAKRVAMAHIALNILGVLVFLPFTGWLAAAAAAMTGNFAGQVALMHALFNILSSLAAASVSRPFSRLIAWLVPGPRPGG